mmetsp:Transcript_23631/g.58409  ORF Transcript_23631/g.58409 Transcript_23631/m.58409 type:complete len:418 (+) Transcript_23631:147-1400(+)|eukprot:CAMPEP_0206239012 /NCGR_PEP_ID=MMETSP0047_2-20121206/15143_1 /ASSEMBLY_ACC=CAM_ASM_000192 /TAXON_ID=195065 /ORGANISM="Chroomonas mesostigmatica_cf, Strain CCMP1168" /LENGTH=417 /DNA_ID=CAMNT_0053663629 /DNA_START=122 /DNA_END=1375 /DNA_ORIENTATION=+
MATELEQQQAVVAEGAMEKLSLDASAAQAQASGQEDESHDPSIVFTPWPKIGQLQAAIKAVSWSLRNQHKDDGQAELPRTLQFRAKVKVDGTNAGVVLSRSANRVGAQSRAKLLTTTKDNSSFCAWVKSTEDFWLTVAAKLPGATVYGEWAGSKINNNGQAVVKIERRVFAVFGIIYRKEDKMEVCPRRIRELLPEHPDVFVLPWCGTFEFDFASREALEKARHGINELVWAVEKVDPWVRDNFGIEGSGEGVVVYRTDHLPEDAPVDSEKCIPFMFKAKAEYARVVRQDAPAQLDTTSFATVDAFANAFVTRARFDQAVRETLAQGEELSTEGAVSERVAKWLVKDIMEEGKAEIEASGFGKKEARAIPHAIRDLAFRMLSDVETDRALDSVVTLAAGAGAAAAGFPAGAASEDTA